MTNRTAIAWFNFTLMVMLCIAIFLLMVWIQPARSAVIDVFGDTITIVGEIKHGDFEDFEAKLTPEVRTVFLLSQGGRMIPALKIGEIVRQRRLKTVTFVQCDSGCAYIW